MNSYVNCGCGSRSQPVAARPTTYDTYAPRRVLLFGMNAFGTAGIAFAPTPEELMAEVVICVIAIRTCSPKRCQIHLSELQWEIYQEYADSEDQESEIVGMFIHLHKLGFVPPLVLQLPMQCLLLQSGTTRVSDLPRPAEYI